MSILINRIKEGLLRESDKSKKKKAKEEYSKLRKDLYQTYRDCFSYTDEEKFKLFVDYTYLDKSLVASKLSAIYGRKPWKRQTCFFFKAPGEIRRLIYVELCGEARLPIGIRKARPFTPYRLSGKRVKMLPQGSKSSVEEWVRNTDPRFCCNGDRDYLPPRPFNAAVNLMRTCKQACDEVLHILASTNEVILHTWRTDQLPHLTRSLSPDFLVNVVSLTSSIYFKKPDEGLALECYKQDTELILFRKHVKSIRELCPNLTKLVINYWHRGMDETDRPQLLHSLAFVKAIDDLVESYGNQLRLAMIFVPFHYFYETWKQNFAEEPEIEDKKIWGLTYRRSQCRMISSTFWRRIKTSDDSQSLGYWVRGDEKIV